MLNNSIAPVYYVVLKGFYERITDQDVYVIQLRE
jgi:hypothetical protein